VARVLQVFEFGTRAIYRVSFSDGTYLDTTADHRWFGWEAMKDYSGHRYWYSHAGPVGEIERGRIYTTEQINAITQKAAGRKEVRGGGKGGSFLIPVCMPVIFTRTNRNPSTVPPYVLGVLLGDGSLSSSSISFSKPDKHVAMRVSQLMGVELVARKSSGRCPMYILPAATGVKAALDRIDLLGCHSWEKFIPEEYKYRKVEERWELLRGLLDTDGTVSTDGKAYYCSTSLQLAEDVRWLVKSLGGVATLTTSASHYTKNGQWTEARDSHDLYVKFRDVREAFTLPRKRDRVKDQQGLYRRVVSVDYVGDEPARCITVDHPNGLYLGGEHFIITHN